MVKIKLGRVATQVAQRESGWTLVEVLVSIGIVLLLSATVGVVSSRYVEHARVAATQHQIAAYALALEAYYADCGTYPSAAQGLEALWKPPVLEPVPRDWNGPYVNSPIGDNPWGRPYEYRSPGPHGLGFAIETTSPRRSFASYE